MKKLLLLTIIFLLVSVSNVSASTPQTLIFIIAGQSNASGRAAYKYPNPLQGVFTYTNAYTLEQERNPVDNPIAQVDMVSVDPKASYSFAVPFSHRLINTHANLNIILVPCAKGGSSILQWNPNYKDRDHLYGSCLHRVKQVLPYGQLGGMLFIQGESDAKYESRAQDWDLYFANFVTAFRQDLGNNFPVLFSQLHCPTTYTLPYWDVVRAAQFDALHMVPNSRMIYTCNIANVGLHFNHEETIKVGLRFANTYNRTFGSMFK